MARSRLKAKSKDSTVSGVNETVTVRPKCKRGFTAVSRGFSSDVLGPGGTITRVSRRDGGRRWEVDQIDSDDAPQDVTGYVYCQRKPKKK